MSASAWTWNLMPGRTHTISRGVRPVEPTRSTSKNPKLPSKEAIGVTRPRRKVTVAYKRLGKNEGHLLRVAPCHRRRTCAGGYV